MIRRQKKKKIGGGGGPKQPSMILFGCWFVLLVSKCTNAVPRSDLVGGCGLLGAVSAHFNDASFFSFFFSPPPSPSLTRRVGGWKEEAVAFRNLSGGEPFNSFPVDNDDTTSRGQECATSGGWPGEEKRAREIQPRFASFFARDFSRSGALMCFVSCSSVSAVQTPLGYNKYLHTTQVQCVWMDGMGEEGTGRSDSLLTSQSCIDSRPLLLFFCAATPSPPLWEGKNTRKCTWLHGYGVTWGGIPVCSGRRLSPRPPTPTPTQPESRNPCVWECCALVGLRLPRLGSTLHSTLSCHSTLVTSIPAFGLVKCPFTLRLGYGCLNRTRATCVHMDESYNNSAPSLFRVRLLFLCFFWVTRNSLLREIKSYRDPSSAIESVVSWFSCFRNTHPTPPSNIRRQH